MTLKDLKNLPKGAVVTAGEFNPAIEKLCIEANFVVIGISSFGKKYEKQY